MKNLVAHFLIAAGLCFFGAAYAIAQDDSSDLVDIYAGSNECRVCHRNVARLHLDTSHARTLNAITDENDTILGDFSTGETLREVTFPDENEARAFTQADIAYALGAGRHIQTYLYESEPDVYYVLPAAWNVTDSEWQAFSLSDNWLSDEHNFVENCAGCHTQQLDVSTNTWQEDSVMCESCHGPGMEHVLIADDAGAIIDDEERVALYSSVNLALDAQVCGQCHSQATDHPFPLDYLPGDELAIALPETSNADYWWESGHASLKYMQYNEWLTSSHSTSLTDIQDADAFNTDCLTCHSAAQQQIDLRIANEDIDPQTIDPHAALEANPIGVTCASCHNPHAEGETTLRDESYALCISCHQDNDITDGMHYPVQEIYEGLPIVDEVAGVASPHFTEEEGPTCTTCHMADVPTAMGNRSTHTFQNILPGVANDVLQDNCTICHEQSPSAMQSLIDDLQAGTRQRIEDVQTTITDESPDWMTVALTTVTNEGSYGIHNYMYTDALLGAMESELGLYKADTPVQLASAIDAILPAKPETVIAENRPSIKVIGAITLPSAIILAVALFTLIFSVFQFYRSDSE